MDSNILSLVPDAETPGATTGIGMVCPFDMALDRELWRWMPWSVSLYFTRTPMPSSRIVDVDMVSALGDHVQMEQAVRSVLGVRPAAVGYACASGSFVHGVAGAKALSDCMRTAGAPSAITTSEALLRALEVMNLGRIAVATPYVASLTDLLCDFVAESGRTVVSQAGLGYDHDIWTIPYSATADLIRAADSPEADAIFVSCTNLPTYDILSVLEAELGKPVLSANQVTAWATLQDAGVMDYAAEPCAQQSLFGRAA